MVKISLQKVTGSNRDEESHSLIRKSWQAGTARPSRKTIYYFVGLMLVLQGLVLWKLFFQGDPVYDNVPYNVTETVALVTAYYELLQSMRYLGRDSIAYPPHTGDKAINLTLAESILGLHPQVIETLLQLPYIIPHEDKRNDAGDYMTDKELEKLHEYQVMYWPGWMGQDRPISWRDGHFVDYRNDTNLWLSRDPLQRWQFSNDAGTSLETAMLDSDSLPNTAIPLSVVGQRKYGMVLVLDTATNRIVVLDTQGFGASDPYFERFAWDKWPGHFKIPKTRFYGQEVHARPAADLLKEFIHLTSHLESGYIPGSVRTDPHYTPKLSPPLWENWVRDLYREYSWPSTEPLEECQFLSLRGNHSCDHDPMANFRGDQFTKAMARLRHNITVKYMPDWYCPVPRNPDFISKLKAYGSLSEEQIAYAESDEPVIPLNTDGWGGNLVFMQG